MQILTNPATPGREITLVGKRTAERYRAGRGNAGNLAADLVALTPEWRVDSTDHHFQDGQWITASRRSLSFLGQADHRLTTETP